MKPKRLSAPTAEPMPLCEAAMVLGGWVATAPNHQCSQCKCWDLLLDECEAGVIRRWRAHEAWLRALAPRLKITPAWNDDLAAERPTTAPALYFGEWLATKAP